MDISQITLPEVAQIGQSARFFKDEGRDYIEIAFVGSKDTIVKKVKPEHMAMFRSEWDHYCDGKPMVLRAGTPLTEVSGVNQLLADNFIKVNIHNAEELAVLNDAQCQGVGHGTLTAREAARKLLSLRAVEQQQSTINQMSKAAASLASPPSADVEALKAEVSELKGMVGDLVKALSAKPKRGRPAKEKAE